ncbi:hypothetical protein LINGRAHAP2_LOCUS34334 [Linum grandiflorum]
MAASQLQSSGMLSREQLLYLFNRFSELTAQPDVKRRIADAVEEKQEAVAVTTALQEGIFLEMGVDPSFGISCLGKVNAVFENDRDLVIQFYKFVAWYVSLISLKRWLVMRLNLDQKNLLIKCIIKKSFMRRQQLEMLKYMRKFHLDDQSAILDKVHLNLEEANFDVEASVLSSNEIEETVRRRVSPLFMPAN